MKLNVIEEIEWKEKHSCSLLDDFFLEIERVSVDVGRYLTAKGNMGALADGDHVSVALCSRFVFCVALAECIL